MIDSSLDPVGLWASAQVSTLKVDTWPEYGSLAWRTLKAEDPRRAAALLEAAEQWRRQVVREHWLDQMLENDPERWFGIVTEQANEVARKRAGALARQPTAAEAARRASQYGPVRPLVATVGWSPVAIPGKPGIRRHLVNGQQIDRPYISTSTTETAE